MRGFVSIVLLFKIFNCCDFVDLEQVSRGQGWFIWVGLRIGNTLITKMVSERIVVGVLNDFLRVGKRGCGGECVGDDVGNNNE